MSKYYKRWKQAGACAKDLKTCNEGGQRHCRSWKRCPQGFCCRIRCRFLVIVMVYVTFGLLEEARSRVLEVRTYWLLSPGIKYSILHAAKNFSKDGMTSFVKFIFTSTCTSGESMSNVFVPKLGSLFGFGILLDLQNVQQNFVLF